MRAGLFIAMVAIGGGFAYTMSRGMSNGTNIEARQKYWEAELAAAGVKAGTSKEDLAAFATAHGEQLHCYTNGKREPQCEIEDAKSMGGTRNMPMRLAAVFVMKDDQVASVQFTTTLASQQQ